MTSAKMRLGEGELLAYYLKDEVETGDLISFSGADEPGEDIPGRDSSGKTPVARDKQSNLRTTALDSPPYHLTWLSEQSFSDHTWLLFSA